MENVTKELNIRLLKAAESGDANCIRRLLRNAAILDLNTKDDLGVCALSKAAKGGHCEVTKLLLESQADPNTTDASLLTPLYLATQKKHLEVVKLLVLAGADLDAKTKDGLRPIDVAQWGTEVWSVLNAAAEGDMPEIEEISDVPVIPDFAITQGGAPKKKGKGKKKGGKKGGKKGKKKGKKKK